MTPSERQAVITEALTWVGTPYRGHSCIKGKRGGVDCGQLLYGVYHGLGLIPEIDLPTDYSLQVGQHQASTEYVSLVDRFFSPIEEAAVLPGDLVLYRIGHAYAHAGIIIEWPSFVVHAELLHGVSGTHGLNNPGLRHRRYMHGADVVFRTLTETEKGGPQ